MRLVVDCSKCSGCRACLLACSLHHFNENNPRKAALAVVAHFPAPGSYEVRVCAQCGTCAEACPQGAINRDDQGVYRVDPHKCEGCLDCVQACPNGVMFVPPGSSCPVKCDLCGTCVEYCGMDALAIDQASGDSKASG